jgi:hypothetical protein
MSMSLLLRIDWDGDQPVGTVALNGGSAGPVPFRGWLELAAAVHRLAPGRPAARREARPAIRR